MGKALGNIIIVIYVIVAIAVTICLLTFNEYKVSVIGDKTLVIINENINDLQFSDGSFIIFEENEEVNDYDLDYEKGDLIIVGKEGFKNAKKGDFVFFYDSKGIKIARIEKKNDFGEAGVTFTIDGNYQVVQDDVIGTSNNIKVIHHIGKVLAILESKWGFLFLIVFPSLLAFLHEIRQLILEITNKDNSAKER